MRFFHDNARKRISNADIANHLNSSDQMADTGPPCFVVDLFSTTTYASHSRSHPRLDVKRDSSWWFKSIDYEVSPQNKKVLRSTALPTTRSVNDNLKSLRGDSRDFPFGSVRNSPSNTCRSRRPDRDSLLWRLPFGSALGAERMEACDPDHLSLRPRP